MNIRFVPRAELDRLKWDSCVHYAINGHLFGYQWYLDQTAREWDGLVEGDYESVMPLPAGPYGSLQHPMLVNELAIYSVRALSPPRVQAFWAAVQERYQTVNLIIEPLSRPPTAQGWTLTDLHQYELLLTVAYDQLAENFSADLLRRLDRAQEADLLPVSTLKPERLAELYRDLHGSEDRNDAKFHGLQRIMYQCLHRGWGSASGMMTRSQELVAAQFSVYAHGRLFNLLALQTEAGRKTDALTLLYDYQLRTHAGRPLLLDFHAAAADIAPGFGAVQRPRVQVHYDQRSRWQRLLRPLTS